MSTKSALMIFFFKNLTKSLKGNCTNNKLVKLEQEKHKKIDSFFSKFVGKSAVAVAFD